MNRDDRAFLFSNNAHCCDERGGRVCRIDCPQTDGDFRRRVVSKLRRVAGRRTIQEALHGE